MTAEDSIRRYQKAQSDLVLQSVDYPLSVFSMMQKQKNLDLNPDFQRRSRWDVLRRSQLIESFLLNVPVPPVYLAEESVGQYSVIDGKQRLSAGVDFINNEYALEGLEHFTELNGKKFKELPSALQSAISSRPYLRVIILLQQSDNELKYEVFRRLNRGGMRLNDQELRNSMFRGPLNDLIYDLASNQFLRKRLKISEKKPTISAAYKEMLDAEYVTRFLAMREFFAESNRSDEYSGNLTETFNQFLIENKNADADRLAYLRERFERAIDYAEKIFGDFAFCKPNGNSSFRNQSVVPMYEAEMLALDRLTDDEADVLTKKSDIVKQELINGFEQDSALGVNFSGFKTAVTVSTNNKSRFLARNKIMYDFFKAVAAL